MPSLIRHLPMEVKRTASTDGGEYASACPRCGGEDRFRVWPDHPDKEAGRFWCRRCGWSGDGIDLLRAEVCTGMSFPQACHCLGLGHKANSDADGDQRRAQLPTPEAAPKPKPPKLLRPPGTAWQREAGAFIEACQHQLWRDTRRAASARDYLTGRGLREETIRAAGLGLNSHTKRPLRTSWGLEPREEKPDGGRIWLPRGVVIPWWKSSGGLWRLSVRRPDGDLHSSGDDPKYVQAAAVRPGSGDEPAWSSNALYGARALRPGRPAVLVEGVFDALAIMQEARTAIPFEAKRKGSPLAAAVACGTAGARCPHWIAKLASARPVLLAFDDDENGAGEDAAAFWERVLPNAARHAPPAGYDDPADMLAEGENVRAWIEEGLQGKTASIKEAANA